MELPFELHVALRYLFARRKQAFISVISFISTLGVTVGVMALVIALALMTGLQQELRNRILGSTAHVYVWKMGGLLDYHAEVKKLLAVPHVTGAAPAILGKALVEGPRNPQFITLKGIDPALEPSVSNIAQALRQGRLQDLDRGDDHAPGILLGDTLANQLGVTVGDSVTILTPEGTLSPMGLIPRTRRLRVVGIFSLGLYEFDAAYGYVTLGVAERLLDVKHPEIIQLRVDDIYRAPAVAAAIPKRLGARYLTQDWTEMNHSLFSALWLEKMAISITIGLIVVVAALNIIASLILLVMEKSRDIAILKTMGASARSVMAIFMIEGLIIGVTGTAVGAGGGVLIAWVMNRYKLIRVPLDVYQVPYVPFTVRPADFAVVVVAAILVCFLATIYPSRQASKLDPAQALRYE
ncbi:MAG TPA: lipoprotein-releasing ABC transporter permease subunit [Vicinamibacterales bacterium]|nr:lipoprotein-releasing ABC transporter permease subunit [Vicinamibacterales bacterium]